MPYSKKQGGGTCSTDQWAVLNKQTGKTMGCHATEAQADKQLAALAINVKESSVKNTIVESVDLAEAASEADRNAGLLPVQILTPGWGSSGYYSPEVCESSASMFTVGTQMFLDHPAADGSGLDKHGNRSIRDLAAVLTESGTWDAANQRVLAKAKITAPYRDLLLDPDVNQNIGLSIRGGAAGMLEGEAEGRRGPIIESITDIKSVDFVTRAGRGGKVLQMVESERFIEEATAEDRARQLSDAVQAAYSGPGTYAYVSDMDAERQVVWYRVSPETGESKTYEQTYDVSDNDVQISLTGDPREVERVTNYVPVNPAGPSSTQESKEDTVAQINVDESEHRSLVEKAGRVDTLEAENAKLKAENTELTESAARAARQRRADEIVSERAKDGDVKFSALESRGLTVDLPLAESGELDEEKFTATVNEAVAERKAASGSGKVSGMGGGISLDEGAGNDNGTKPSKAIWDEIDESLGIKHTQEA